jgi:lysophospholipase L1-like esterase
MMDKALGYDVQPILSTIIPRDTNDYRTQRERGIAISEGIRSIAIEKNIPLIDFWDIFDNYPESDGGYYSLTSDHVHPSEKGYQLMAEEWLESLEDIIKPKMPENITISNGSNLWKIL